MTSVLLTWYVVVFDALEVKSKDLPDEDNLPAWFLDQNLTRDLTNHWRSRPPVPGDK